MRDGQMASGAHEDCSKECAEVRNPDGHWNSLGNREFFAKDRQYLARCGGRKMNPSHPDGALLKARHRQQPTAQQPGLEIGC